MKSSSMNTISDEFLQQLRAGNRTGCSALVKEFLEVNSSVIDLYELLFKPALYEIGRLWETNQISVATEHMATAITEGIQNELYDQLIVSKKINKKVVVACVENEQHQVGVKMVADIFESKGWESFFLGHSIPTNELVRFIHQHNPDIIALSLSIYFNFNKLLQMLTSLRAEFPTIQIIVGGQAFTHSSAEIIKQLGNVFLLSNLYELESYINQFNK